MTDKQFLKAVTDEVRRARAKFPGNNATNAALVEEVGELSKALMYEPFSNVIAEAVQVACMAMRIATEGDSTMDDFRFNVFHQEGTRYCLPEHILPGSKYAAQMAQRIEKSLQELSNDEA